MKNILLILSFTVSPWAVAQQYELPAPGPREQLVKHTAYTLSYAEGYELPSWVAFELTSDQAKATGTFREKYTEDPLVATGSSSPKDYRNAGFIMAQLVPAEDMLWSPKAAEETFLMSNIVPQKPAFNKYVWKVTQNLIREWAKEGNTLYIATGPVLADAPFGSFGVNKVSIPKRYYIAVLDASAQRAIGFLIPCSNASGTPKSFAVSVDELEKVTGIDFFPSLSDDLENSVESSTDFTKWNFNALKQ